MSRDYDTQRVYDVENNLRDLLESTTEDSTMVRVEAFGSHLVIPTSRKFASIESIQAYVDRVLALPAVAQVNDRGPVKVRKRRGDRFATYDWAGYINIPDAKWAMNEPVVLHELAHHLAYGDLHGPRFREAFCYLIEESMSPEAAFYLRSSFIEAGLPPAFTRSIA